MEAKFMGLEIINNNPDYKTAYFNKLRQQAVVDEAPLPGSGAAAAEAQHKATIDEAVKNLRNAGDLFNKRLDFRVDEKTNRIVVKVIDTRTDKVIKEIPPEQLLHLAAKIQEMVGLLVDEER
jgi:flagellar protein FlaG